MSELTHGPYGSMIGRTGNNVGRWVNGQNVFSIKPHASNKPATESQLNVRLALAFIVLFLRGLAGAIKIGFKNHRKPRESAMNAAVSYNYQKALIGVAPDFAIDYTELTFSKGPLIAPFPKFASTLTAGAAKVEFETDSDGEFSFPTDLITVVAYSVDRERFVVLKDATTRSTGSCTIQLPQSFVGDDVHFYISAMSVTGKVSDSAHVGHVTII